MVTNQLLTNDIIVVDNSDIRAPKYKSHTVTSIAVIYKKTDSERVQSITKYEFI